MFSEYCAARAQHVRDGRFESDMALCTYLLEPFPFLLMAAYKADERHGLTYRFEGSTGSGDKTGNESYVTIENPVNDIVSAPHPQRRGAEPSPRSAEFLSTAVDVEERVPSPPPMPARGNKQTVALDDFGGAEDDFV